MASSIISFRIDDGLREKVRSWSALEHRTISNFMEALLHRESELRDGEVVTLESLDVKLERLLVMSEKAKVKPAKKVVDSNGKKLTAYDMEFDDFLDEASWRKWVDHLHKSEVHLNHYQGKGQYERFRELDDIGINCSTLIKELIKRTAKSIYVPIEWQRELAEG